MPEFINDYAAGQRDSRPWGDWAVLDAGPGYAVKRITVTPGGRLSLQRHEHRVEHWFVVAGRAHVTRNAEELSLGVGEGVDFAMGDVHRVANEGYRGSRFHRGPAWVDTAGKRYRAAGGCLRPHLISIGIIAGPAVADRGGPVGRHPAG